MIRNKEEMYNLFKETEKLTNNFKRIEPYSLENNPSSLIIFRHILKISQKEFSKIIKISSTHLCDLENGKEKMSKELSKNIPIKINNYLKNNKTSILFEDVHNSYKRFIKLNKLTKNRAKEIRKLRIIYSQIVKKEDVLNLWKEVLNTSRLARIVSQINGDGHLQLTKNNGLTSFNSNNFYEIENIKKEFKELFSIKGIVYKNYKDSKKHKIFFPGKRIALFLMENGVMVGNKTNQCYQIPKWIVCGNNEIKSVYLKGFYDTEGSIYSSKQKNGKIRWRINLIQVKNEKLKNNGIKYMEQIRLLLKNFEIESSPVRVNKGNIRKDGSKSIFLRFDIEYKGFENFYKHIGFDNKKKQKRLIASLNIGRIAKSG